MDLARFRSVRRMSDGHQGDYRTVAIVVEEMRGKEGRRERENSLEDPVLAVEEGDVEVAGVSALERLIEVGGWPRSIFFCFSPSLSRSLFLDVTQ